MNRAHTRNPSRIEVNHVYRKVLAVRPGLNALEKPYSPSIEHRRWWRKLIAGHCALPTPVSPIDIPDAFREAFQ